MERIKRLPLMGLIAAGLLLFGLGCDDDPEVPPTGEIRLSTHLLDFGDTETELQFFVTNIGDSTLIWYIASIPDWAQATPDTGTLVEDDTTWIMVQIERDSLDSDTTTGSLVIHTDADDVSLTLIVQRPLAGHLTLETDTLDFGETLTEQQLALSNTGNAALIWSINDIPDWMDIDPASGTIGAGAQIQVTIGVQRLTVDPGALMDTLLFLSNFNDDSLVVLMQRVCNLLGDNFNEGAAADWDATALDVAQHNDGYVVLDPNSVVEAGQLMQTISPTAPYTISARVRRTVQTADHKHYGLLLEGSTTDDALYFAVTVDDDTNYTIQQSVAGNWDTLSTGYSNSLSIAEEVWNTLRLDIYEDSGTLYARGYAGIDDTPLFENIELDSTLNFTKIGIRSDEYMIHADWFCATSH